MGSAGERKDREVAAFLDRYIFLLEPIFIVVHTVIRGVAPSGVRLRESKPCVPLFLDNPHLSEAE